MFVPEKTLRNLIISYVKDEERSISGLARKLTEDGYKMHRLFLTGYLRAMSDMGILKEKEIPPSKVYTTSVQREKNIYELVGEKCKSLEIVERDRATVALSVLEKLFKRPIFLREIRECGFDDVVAKRVIGDKRAEARRRLIDNGVEIPGNDPAYTAGEGFGEPANTIIRELVLDKFAAHHLRLDTKQTRLTEIE